MFDLIILYLVCASMFTISKWGLAYAEPFFFLIVRMILAGVLLWGYLLVRGTGVKDMIARSLQDWLLFAQIIFFHIYLTYIWDMYALQYLTSIESAFIYNLSPFVAAFFSYVWFREYMTRKKWFGLLLGMGAFVPELIITGPGSLFIRVVPRLLTLGAVISSSYGWVVFRALVKKGYSPLFINGISMFCGGILALITSYTTETWIVTEWVPFIQATVLIVIAANIVFYNLYGYLLKYYTATFLSFAGFLCPFFAAFLGRIFLGETFSWHLALSFVVTCIGLFIFYHEELKQGYIKRN